MSQRSVSHEVMGEICAYNLGDMQVNVKVMDIQKLNGKTSLLVIPCDGKGMQWVDANKISFTFETINKGQN